MKFPPDGIPYFKPPYEKGENDDLEPAATVGPDPDRQPVHKEPNKGHARRYATGKCT